jgi:hypothetical protein
MICGLEISGAKSKTDPESLDGSDGGNYFQSPAAKPTPNLLYVVEAPLAPIACRSHKLRSLVIERAPHSLMI